MVRCVAAYLEATHIRVEVEGCRRGMASAAAASRMAVVASEASEASAASAASVASPSVAPAAYEEPGTAAAPEAPVSVVAPWLRDAEAVSQCPDDSRGIARKQDAGKARSGGRCLMAEKLSTTGNSWKRKNGRLKCCRRAKVQSGKEPSPQSQPQASFLPETLNPGRRTCVASRSSLPTVHPTVSRSFSARINSKVSRAVARRGRVVEWAKAMEWGVQARLNGACLVCCGWVQNRPQLPRCRVCRAQIGHVTQKAEVCLSHALGTARFDSRARF